MKRPNYDIDYGLAEHPEPIPKWAACDSLHNLVARDDMVGLREKLFHGADTETHDDHGDTPLGLACFCRNRPAIELLLQFGAEIEAPSRNGWRPLHAAVHSGAKGVVVRVLSHGAKVNSRCPLGYTPLHLAAIRGYDEIASLLMSWGANANIVEKFGTNALHSALIFKKSRRMIRTLVWGMYLECPPSSDLPIETKHDLVSIVAGALPRGTHDRLGEESPVRLLVGFDFILQFIVAHSLPEWMLTNPDKLPQLL